MQVPLILPSGSAIQCSIHSTQHRTVHQAIRTYFSNTTAAELNMNATATLTTATAPIDSFEVGYSQSM
jgi:hypothetical protein